jgi:two-component system cell cycle response regulator
MTTQYRELVEILQTVGTDPSRLIFEDELTGLNNRRFLLSFFEHKVQWDKETDFPLSLLILDLDHFKQINDTHGHEAGDQVLLWLSSLMREISGDEHFPIRYGGDEFMMPLPGAEADEARMLADLLCSGPGPAHFSCGEPRNRYPSRSASGWLAPHGTPATATG